METPRPDSEHSDSAGWGGRMLDGLHFKGTLRDRMLKPFVDGESESDILIKDHRH